MKKIYLFSGLGTDKRIFQLLDLSDYDTVFVEWIVPQNNETIEEYAKKIIFQENFNSQNYKPTLVGVSFGGMLAVEIAKLIPTEKVVLISSAKTKYEIPFYFRWIGKLYIDKIIPAKWLKHSTKITDMITNWFFGAKSNFDKKLLKEIIKDTNEIFLKWAIGQIVRWRNTSKLKNIIHIHGTKDKILPIYFADYDHKIIDGGHFMTLNKAEEINKKLKEIL